MVTIPDVMIKVIDLHTGINSKLVWGNSSLHLNKCLRKKSFNISFKLFNEDDTTLQVAPKQIIVTVKYTPRVSGFNFEFYQQLFTKNSQTFSVNHSVCLEISETI